MTDSLNDMFDEADLAIITKSLARTAPETTPETPPKTTQEGTPAEAAGLARPAGEEPAAAEGGPKTTAETPAETTAETPAEPPGDAARTETERSGPSGMVPLSALQQERRKRQTVESKFEELSEQLTVLLERLTPPPPKEEEPTLESDPVGYLRRIEKRQAEQDATIRQRMEQERLAASVVPQVREFRRQHEDYDAAYAHARQVMTTFINATGVPENQIETQLNSIEELIARSALAAKRNPAEIIYNMARQAGYVPQQATAAAQPARAAARPAGKDMQDRHKSLSSIPGTPTKVNEELSLERFAAMSRKEQDAILSQAPLRQKIEDLLQGL